MSVGSTANLNASVPRRDFLYIATGCATAVGLAFASWPFVDQMEPSEAAIAAGAPISVDVSSVMTGQQMLVLWRKRPIFVVHRTAAALAQLKAPGLRMQLRDPDSDEPQQPPYAKNWCRSIRPDYLVVVGVCTHLGCIPTYAGNAGGLGSSWPGGYLCHCHGSKYDLAGRVFRGVPAPFNLPVPPYRFANARTLVIGESPPGINFQLSSVKQI